MKQTIDDVDRRTVLRGVGTVAAAGMLAGCGGGGGNGSDGGGNGNGDTPTDGGGGGVPSAVSDYLTKDPKANGYTGSVVDKTDSSSVTVKVGAGSNGLAFDPAAIRISTGTTVTWDWTGKGGAHNVVANDGTFDSGSAVDSSSETFEYTFESSGNYLYHCVPHEALGMKGAVIVE